MTGAARSMASGDSAPDAFELYDLAVVVERIDGQCACDMAVGDTVLVRGGKLALPTGQSWPS